MQDVHKLVQIIVEVAQRLILNPQSKVIMFLYSQRSCGLLTLLHDKCIHFQCFITLLKKNHSHCTQNIVHIYTKSTGERVKASNTEEHLISYHSDMMPSCQKGSNIQCLVRDSNTPSAGDSWNMNCSWSSGNKEGSLYHWAGADTSGPKYKL